MPCAILDLGARNRSSVQNSFVRQIPNNNPMKIPLQKIISNNPAKGIYTGHISGYSVSNSLGSNSNDTVCLEFAFSSSKHKNVEYECCELYSLSNEDSACELASQIHDLLGERLWKQQDKDGMFDLDNLIDEKCEIVIDKDSDDDPFAIVQAFGPVGKYSLP